MKHVIDGVMLLLVVLSACGMAPPASTNAAVSPAGAVPTGTASPVLALIDPTPVMLPTALPPTRVPGVIHFYQEATDDVVQAPEDVAVHTPFDVTITTFGDGCITAGAAEVAVIGNVATITVTDLHQPGPCIQPLLRFPRTVTVQFAILGDGVIRVVEQRLGPETGGVTAGAPATLERRVRVH